MINSFDGISRTSSQLTISDAGSTLKGITPHEAICKASTKEPDRFTLNPDQKMPGPKI
jgi:hypothetical protein